MFNLTRLLNTVRIATYHVHRIVSKPTISLPTPKQHSTHRNFWYYKITQSHLRTILDYHKLSYALDRHFVDKTYLLPKGIESVEQLQILGQPRVSYVAERRDCDDFAIMFKANLSQHTLGNATVGIYCAQFVNTRTRRTMNHAVNLIVWVDDAGKFRVDLHDPQLSDIFMDLTNWKVYPFFYIM